MALPASECQLICVANDKALDLLDDKAVTRSSSPTTSTQQWRIVSLQGEKDSAGKTIADEEYAIESLASEGKRLRATGGWWGDVVLSEYSGKSDQRWRITTLEGHDEYRLENVQHRQALDSYFGGRKDGNRVISHGWHGLPNQRWRLTPLQSQDRTAKNGGTGEDKAPKKGRTGQAKTPRTEGPVEEKAATTGGPDQKKAAKARGPGGEKTAKTGAEKARDGDVGSQNRTKKARTSPAPPANPEVPTLADETASKERQESHVANDATPQERYREVLMQRTREDRYPSHHLLDRIEACLETQEHTDDYVNLLVDKMQETHYPSNGIMDRIQRLTCRAPS